MLEYLLTNLTMSLTLRTKTQLWPGTLGGWSGSWDVTAAANMTDNTLIKWDGGAKWIQDSWITVDDSDNVSWVWTLGCWAITTSGELAIGENGILLDPAMSADGKYSWIIRWGTAWATVAFGDLCYLDPTASKWLLADISAAAAADGDTRTLLWICILAAVDTWATTMLLQWVVRADTAFPALTIGAAAYAWDAAWDIQTTAPATSGDVSRIVWFATTADELYFSPSSDWIIIA